MTSPPESRQRPPVAYRSSANDPNAVGWDRGADRASNDADVSSIPPYHSVRRVFPSTAGRLAFQAVPSRIISGLSLLPARFSRLRWFATATACQVAGPPVRI